MKKYLIALVLGLWGQMIWAQLCPDYEEIIQQAENLLAKEQYIPALKKLNGAKEYCPSKTREVDAEINKVIAAIERKKQQAEKVSAYFQFGKEKAAWAYDFVSGKFAVINRKGDRLTEFLYDAPEGFKDGVAIAKVNNQFVFVQVDGKEVEGRYDFLLPTVGGMYLSQYDEKLFLIDKKGQFLFYVRDREDFLEIESKERKIGALSVSGKLLIPPLYDDIRWASQGLYWVQAGGQPNDDGYLVGGQWGLVDSPGKILIKPQYDDIESVSMGLYKVNVGGKTNDDGDIVGGQWGLVDSLGKILIKPQYDYIESVSMGLYRVQVGGKSNDDGDIVGGQWGLVDSLGKVLIKPQYDYIESASQGLFRVNVGGKTNDDGDIVGGQWGLVDSLGKVLIKPQYDYIGWALGGLSRVNVGGKTNDYGNIVGGQWGLVDSLGKVLIKPQYDYIESVSMGLYRVNVGGKSGILGGIEGGQWGLVDSLGKVLINPQYETINYDSRGFYKVTLRNKEGFVKSLKWGINNTEGTEIISPMYEEIISTNHSELLIVKKSEKWGVVNARGEEKITIIYDEIIDKKDGFFQVNRSGKWGLIRYNGREILPAIYDFIGDFINNTARVNIGGTIESKYFEDIKGGTWGVIDTSGTVVIQPKYDELSELSHGIFFARTGSTYDLLRVDQKTLFDKKNDYVLEYKDSLAIINHGGEIDRDHEPTGGKSGIINRFGVELISPQFDDIAILSNKLIAINQGGSIYNEDMLIGGKWGLLNLSSQKLIPVKYEAIKVFSNGFIAINIGGIVKNHDIKGGKWGLLNSIGEEVFPPKYEFITSLSNGSFQVNQGGVYDDGNVYNNDCCLIGGRWGLINLDGQEIVPPMYDFMEDFKEGYAKIRIADKWGLLKDNGKVIVPVKYIALASLGKGKAIVQEKIPNSSGESEEIWKIVDSLGYEQKLAEHIYEVFEPHNGIAQIRSWERAEYDNKLGLIDSLGNIILTPKYTGIDNVFKNSRARVINSEYGKWGIINDKGEEVVPPIYEFISEIKKGVASFSVGSSIESRFDGEYVIGGTWGLMNVDQGKILTEPKYQFLSITHDGIGKVNVGGSTFNDYGEIIGGKWGLINSKGEEITKIIYDELTFLGNGLFKVKMGGRWDDDYLHGGKEGLITHLGQELVPAKYEEIESFRDGYSKAIIAKKIGLLSINGEVLPPIYTNIYFVGYHIFLLEQNGRFGLYAPDHGVFLPCNYEEIGYLKEEKDWIRVKQNGKWGWVDKKGKVMIPIRYDAIAPFEDGKAPVIQLPYEDHFFINYQGEFFLESLRKREEE